MGNKAVSSFAVDPEIYSGYRPFTVSRLLRDLGKTAPESEIILSQLFFLCQR